MIKAGVSVRGIRPEIVLAFVIVQPIARSFGVDAVITSCTEGSHSEGSLHYTGQAIDVRTRGRPRRGPGRARAGDRRCARGRV